MPTGPYPTDCDGGSLWFMGGWVAPPKEDRIARRAEYSGDYTDHLDPAWVPQYKYSYPGSRIAEDASFTGPTLSEKGFQAPRWDEVCDPTLEDVYWLVWQLIAGKRYVGFRPGMGAGGTRRGITNSGSLTRCPFESPSAESLKDSANRPSSL